jgi:hypothetical protein
MRSHLYHLAWLAAGITACATATVDQVTPTKHDAGAADAALFGNDAAPSGGDAAPSDDGGAGKDAATPDSGGGSDSGGSNCTAYTGALAAYDFSGEPGDQTSTTASSAAAGVSAGDLTRSSALTPTTGTSSINSSNWTTSTTPDTTRYYTLTLTPENGCALDVTSLSVTTAASKTGPASASVATSDDSFATTVPFTVGSTDTPSLSVSGATGAVEIRLYGFSASSTAGTLRINSTLTVSGSLH